MGQARIVDHQPFRVELHIAAEVARSEADERTASVRPRWVYVCREACTVRSGTETQAIRNVRSPGARWSPCRSTGMVLVSGHRPRSQSSAPSISGAAFRRPSTGRSRRAAGAARANRWRSRRAHAAHGSRSPRRCRARTRSSRPPAGFRPRVHGPGASCPGARSMRSRTLAPGDFPCEDVRGDHVLSLMSARSRGHGDARHDVCAAESPIFGSNPTHG